MAGAAIFVLALGLRLFNLTLLPIFADEAIYIRWAQVMRAESTLRFLPLSDGKQPLFMWLVIPFLKLFSNPLFAGRFTSITAGLGTMLGIFLISYFLFRSKKVSLAASFIYAISPFSLFFDRMALVDSLLSLFGVWTLYFGLLTAKTERLDFAMLTGFSLGGALLTKSPGIFFTILLPTTWLLSKWPQEINEKLVHLIKLLFLLAVTYFIGYAMYNILRLGPNFHLVGTRNQDYIFPLSHLLTNPRDPFVFYIDRSFEWIRMMGPNFVLALAFLGIILNIRKNYRQILLLSAWFLFPILVQSEFAKVITARYILFSLPYLFILSASAFTQNKKLIKKLVVGFMIVFVLQALFFDYYLLTNPQKANLPRSERSGYLEEWTAGTGIKEVADLIRKEAAVNKEKIVVGTEGYFGTLPDGLQMYLNDLLTEKVTVMGVGIDLSEIPQSLIDSKKAGNKTYLAINSCRLHIKNPEERGLKIIAAYPKAVRPDGNKEYVKCGPRDTFNLLELVSF